MNTLSCPIPSNINPLSPNGFMFSVQKLPGLSFFCQQIEIPSITLPHINQATPLSTNIMAGDVVEYGELNVQFLIDERMENYTAVWNWMISLGFPESWEQYTDYRNQTTVQQLSEVKKNFSDGFIQILGSNNKVVQTIEIYDMYPTNLQSLTFQSTNADVTYLVGNATFKYDLYKFV